MVCSRNTRGTAGNGMECSVGGKVGVGAARGCSLTVSWAWGLGCVPGASRRALVGYRGSRGSGTPTPAPVCSAGCSQDPRPQLFCSPLSLCSCRSPWALLHPTRKDGAF